MPPEKHAKLGPSGAHRWLNCTPSANQELEFADRSTEAAAEGTAAHALAEHKLRKALKMRSTRPVSQYDCDEMEGHTDDYAQFIMESLEEAQQLCADPLVLIEQRLALGALRLFDGLYDIDTVAMTVYQPRRDNVSTWTTTVDELLAWAEDTLKPKAQMAFNGEGEFTPGPWCTFCKAAVKCRARAEAKLQLAKYEFAKPPLLTDEEIEEILGKLDDLTKWASEIVAYAQDAAINHGKQWNGFKLVESKTNRKYSDEAAVIDAAKAAGYHDIFRKTLIPITEMEKLMGKKSFASILGSLVVKPQGKPTLVPASDKRPAITTAGANDDFNEFMED